MPEYRFPSSPPKKAMEWFRAKGMKPGFDYRDVWKQEHSNAFTVAKAMKMDVLTAVREAVDRSLAEGQTFAQFQKQLIPTLQQLGWWGKQEATDPLTREKRVVQLGSPRRLKTIYSTNLRTARAAGQWERITRRQKTHPYLIYELGPSEHHRLQHESWAGLVLPADDNFWTTHFPPNGWGCKCRVRQITKREADRLIGTGRYTDKAPKIRRKEWINERTGEVFRVPTGIDPGWDYNPGTQRAKALKTNLKQSQAAVKKAVSKPVPAANVPVFPEGDSLVLSTVRNVDQAGIEQVLNRIPGAAPQLELVRDFMAKRGIKSLMIKQTEMGTGKTAIKMNDQVSEFLGVRSAYGMYNSRRTKWVNGFTARHWEHIVVKVRSTDRLSVIDGEKMAQAVETAIETAQKQDRLWSMRAIYDQSVDKGHNGLVNTWIHELGHQVHFWAGTPPAPVKEALTMYSETNHKEWYAEHFTAWLLNRDALARWNPDVAEHFDRLIKAATTSKLKG